MQSQDNGKMPYDFAGKRVLVTAASSGIGKATAAAFQIAGAQVAICARGQDKLMQTKHELEAMGVQPVFAQATDLSDFKDINRLVDSIEQHFGSLDVLVNNAGGPPPGAHRDLDDGQWAKAFDLTLRSAIRITDRVLPSMKKSEDGRIINLSSYSVKQPMSGMMLSNSIRLAALGWAKTLSNELAPYNILVNTICTGWTQTSRVEQLLDSRATEQRASRETIAKDITSSIPLNRMARPEEIASVVLFLASPAASYITGAAIPVDGGCSQTI